MSFTLYLWIQIPLTIALVCFVIYQHRVYSKQKKLVKKMIERQKQNVEETEWEISEDLLKWREERRKFNYQWRKLENSRSKWPWW